MSPELQSFVLGTRWSTDLTTHQLARVCGDIIERTYDAGTVICRAGDIAEHWLGVIEGIVKVETVAQDGRQTTFAGVPAGAWFGEGAVLKCRSRDLI